ncbi:helix-turn-helix transcriptional regulator [Rhodococcus sp. NCIMB 12038]|uniref:helix-turn-helix transcriptional regulator n=1 Tax=Rhodococcus sp. NCIMB 12038 TaxID=933800 RepID=UPI000B3D3942|nr:LuxR family transcriptional regulator [Rhodococcus sp. NCIMB 12038]OUS91316.1 hypothetical protein CA951_33190 [Rhodococcus sp. NCIMB 12038]
MTTTSKSAPRSITDPWPLIGRTAEVEDVCARIRAKRSVLLAGPAGVGKSRLAGEVLDVLVREGVQTVRISATTASSGIPLGVFAPILPTSAWAGKSGAVNDRADLLSRCANTLVEQYLPARLVLLVDDIHLVDDMSATLLYQLADTDRVTILATYRTKETSPEHVVGLWKNELVDRLDVEGLETGHIQEMIRRALGGPVDDATMAYLAGKVQGNMLFLRELVISLYERGTLREDNGIWRLQGEFEATDRLVELVTSRIGVLTPDEHTLLAYLAFGEPLALPEIERLSTMECAHQLEQKGLVVTEVGGTDLQLRTAHPLYSEVLRGSLPLLRSRELVRRLADTLEHGGPQTDQRLMRIAEWRLLGGGGDPRTMLAAAQIARWHYDFGLAERMVSAVLSVEANFDARILRAQLAGLRGNTRESARLLSALADAAGSVDEVFRVAVARLDHRAIYAGTVEEGLDVAYEAERALAGTPYVNDIAARRAALILGKEGPAGAVALTESLLQEATGSALVWACMPGAYSLARTGRIADALDAAALGHRVQLELDEPMDWYPCMHRFYEAEAHAHAGRFDRAEEIGRIEYRAAVDQQAIEAQALFCWQRAKTVADCGNPHRAIRLLLTAISIYRQLGRPQFAQFCDYYLAMAQAMAGAPEEGRKYLTDLDSSGLPSTWFMGVDPIHSSGWVNALSGDLRRAHADFERAVAEGCRIGDLVGAIAAAHSLARTGAPRRARELCTSLSRAIEGDLVSARVAHIHALDAVDPEELGEVSERFERMGATLLAAEAAADAAPIWQNRGDRRRATACRLRANVLAGKCENPVTLSLSSADWSSKLTVAEKETALLAASGRSNKAIATQLSISVRTVENRLQGVYVKLGIHGRHELPGVVSEYTETD